MIPSINRERISRITFSHLSSSVGNIFSPLYLVVLVISLLVFGYPEFYLAMLQGGMGIGRAAVESTGLDIPDGSTLPFIAVLCLVTSSLYLIVNPGRITAYLLPLSVLVFLQVILLLIGSSYSWNPNALQKTGLFIASNAVTYTVAASLAGTHRRRLIYLLLLVSLILAVGVTISFVTGGQGSLRGRYEAFEMGSIGIGRIIGLGVILTLYVPLRSTIRYMTLALLFVGLLLVASRGPILALVITVIIVSTFLTSRIRQLKVSKHIFVLFLMGLLAVLAILYVGLNANISNLAENWGPLRLISETNLQDRNIISRYSHIDNSLQDFLAHPLLGWGTAGYLGSSMYPPTDGFSWPHNIVFEILAEFGLLGVLIFGTSLVVMFLMFIKLWQQQAMRKESNNRRELIIVAAISVYSLINSMFSFNITGNQSIWLAAGLLAAIWIDNNFFQKKL